jgi:hypothetical protein
MSSTNHENKILNIGVQWVLYTIECTMFVDRVTRRMPLMEQEIPTFRRTWVHTGFQWCSCYSIFSFICKTWWIIVYPFVLFLLALMLSASNYGFWLSLWYLQILLVWCVCLVDRCLTFCTFSYGHNVVCSSLIYGFWLPLWYLQTLIWKRWLHITYIKYNFRWHWGWILDWKWQLGNIWRRN